MRSHVRLDPTREGFHFRISLRCHHPEESKVLRHELKVLSTTTQNVAGRTKTLVIERKQFTPLAVVMNPS